MLYTYPQATRQPRYRCITHMHSYASTSDASPLLPVINSAMSQIIGTDASHLQWSESLITLHHLESILAGGYGDIDLLCLTDHKNLRSHILPPEQIELAVRWPHMIMGAEVTTNMLDTSTGQWLRSPEVLLYGPARQRFSAGGESYWGLEQKDLDDLYACCVPEGAPEADIFKVMEFAEERGFAWALAHPLDANDLELRQVLPILARARAIEVLNGGFPRRSAVHLAAYAEVHNAVVTEDFPQFTSATLSTEQQDMLATIKKYACGRIIPLGGSDAHVSNYDRTVTWVSPNGQSNELSAPQAFLKGLRSNGKPVATFEPEGRSASTVGTYREAWTVVQTMLRNNRNLMSVQQTTKAFVVGANIVRDRITTYFNGQKRLVHQAQQLDLPGIAAITKQQPVKHKIAV